VSWEHRGVKDGRPLRDVVTVTSRIEEMGGAPSALLLPGASRDGVIPPVVIKGPNA
jgi:hypothetical protein